MEWLSEDPWYVVGALGLFSLGCLIALKLTQQGKYLIWAGVALAIAVVWLTVEQLWVTDAERIEAVVKDLVRAVRRSDADAVMAHMTPDVQLTQGPNTLEGVDFETVLRGNLERTKFDFLTVSRIDASAGAQTRRGSANFVVHASGSYATPLGALNFAFGPSGSDWSLGFEEDSHGDWKINRVTALRLPPRTEIPMSPGSFR